MLFSKMERTFDGPKPYAEPDFEYLDRSARAEAGAIRETMDQWLANYPTAARGDLIARFRSPLEAQHRGAAFELYLHELHRRLGYRLEVHPTTGSGKATQPDFLVEHEAGGKFYLEAVQSIEEATEDQSAMARVNVVYDTINELASHNFFVGVDYSRPPQSSPSGRVLRDKLGEWLATLDPDKVAEDIEERGSDGFPKLEHKDKDWEVTFTAIPRAPEKRGEPAGAVIGVLGARGGWLRTWSKIRDSLLAKGRRYGELQHPLVIAVNAVSNHLDRIDEMQALFGQEQFVIQRDNPTLEPRMERAPNGFWYGPKGPRYTRVGGVILGYDLKPWTFAVRDLSLYVHPQSKGELPGRLLELPTARVVEGRITWSKGRRPGDILELPNNYPGRAMQS